MGSLANWSALAGAAKGFDIGVQRMREDKAAEMQKLHDEKMRKLEHNLALKRQREQNVFLGGEGDKNRTSNYNIAVLREDRADARHKTTEENTTSRLQQTFDANAALQDDEQLARSLAAAEKRMFDLQKYLHESRERRFLQGEQLDADQEAAARRYLHEMNVLTTTIQNNNMQNSFDRILKDVMQKRQLGTMSAMQLRDLAHASIENELDRMADVWQVMYTEEQRAARQAADHEQEQIIQQLDHGHELAKQGKEWANILELEEIKSLSELERLAVKHGYDMEKQGKQLESDEKIAWWRNNTALELQENDHYREQAAEIFQAQVDLVLQGNELDSKEMIALRNQLTPVLISMLNEKQQDSSALFYTQAASDDNVHTKKPTFSGIYTPALGGTTWKRGTVQNAWFGDDTIEYAFPSYVSTPAQEKAYLERFENDTELQEWSKGIEAKLDKNEKPDMNNVADYVNGSLNVGAAVPHSILNYYLSGAKDVK